MTDSLRRRLGLALAVLTGLFVLRVLGQALVAFFSVGFLPPMEQWYSGLVPYATLLPIQIAMIAVMIKLVADVVRGAGWFSRANRGVGRFLKWFSYVYFASMVARYAITMTVYPERRWLSGTIPIWFHMVLAAFVFVYGTYHVRWTLEPRAKASPHAS
jgi:hypothetical protein